MSVRFPRFALRQRSFRYQQVPGSPSFIRVVARPIPALCCGRMCPRVLTRSRSAATNLGGWPRSRPRSHRGSASEAHEVAVHTDPRQEYIAPSTIWPASPASEASSLFLIDRVRGTERHGCPLRMLVLRTIKFYPSRTKSSVIGSRDYRHVSLIRARSDCGVNNVPSSPLNRTES